MTAPDGRPRVLVVDNRDSFVYNIVQALLALGAHCDVRERARTTRADAEGADGILISPGPGHPADTGICLDLLRDAEHTGRPVLGVCLGMQALAHAYGASVGHAPAVVHGYTSEVHHTGAGVFAGLPSPFKATRYHSLAVDPETVPDVLEITARTSDGVVMGLRHRSSPVEGVQFHPESILSEHGEELLAGWLRGLA
ncbi:aminodeoxychorismate synthase glutamine amidotransferase subunit [Actinocorallia herbida]|uniref:Aminodeoxychorismate synthase glutamine amidotransferase subunit n=1 Tax=Actinocorallia herbida TaxID=58109 RepID=A0A3N1DAZ4_9ACTN|nr:gamma-glutamyl-gamma-aminobutyrate hydrolase family protein [Actinocorallia herbida]ROO90679.1 aminodeoxychorismate synthase glutamine amidotransferase subunit [Actinocorallia herbida]